MRGNKISASWVSPKWVNSKSSTDTIIPIPISALEFQIDTNTKFDDPFCTDTDIADTITNIEYFQHTDADILDPYRYQVSILVLVLVYRLVSGIGRTLATI